MPAVDVLFRGVEPVCEGEAVKDGEVPDTPANAVVSREGVAEVEPMMVEADVICAVLWLGAVVEAGVELAEIAEACTCVAGTLLVL